MGPIEPVSVLVIHGTNEHPDQVNGFPLTGYVVANPPKHLVVVTGANHFGYTDEICLADEDNSSQVGGVTDQEAHARQQLAARNYILAFFSHYYLQNRSDMIEYLIQERGERCNDNPDIPPDCSEPRRRFGDLDNLNVEVSVCSCTR